MIEACIILLCCEILRHYQDQDFSARSSNANQMMRIPEYIKKYYLTAALQSMPNTSASTPTTSAPTLKNRRAFLQRTGKSSAEAPGQLPSGQHRHTHLGGSRAGGLQQSWFLLPEICLILSAIPRPMERKRHSTTRSSPAGKESSK